jgi:[ribosomal protein S5]-alanine N-acetyltransferase
MQNLSYKKNTFYSLSLLITVLSSSYANASYLRKNLEAKNYFHEFKPIETERLIIRTMNQDDLDALFTIMSDSEVVNQTAALELQSDISETKVLLDSIMDEYSKKSTPEWVMLAIADKQTQKMLGFCCYFGYTPTFARLEFGYTLSRSSWGKGYATEASRGFIDFIFKTMGVNRIEATVYPENIPSVKVLEKVGMEYEGLMRQHVMRNGQFRDRKLYALLSAKKLNVKQENQENIINETKDSHMKMRVFQQNKLWRDKAVERMENLGSKIHWKRLDDVQADKQLRLKMLEESQEVLEAKSKDELIEELADVLEVMQALSKVNNISWDDIVLVQNKKRQERGGFDDRKFVTNAEHPKGSFGEQYCLKNLEKYPEIL